MKEPSDSLRWQEIPELSTQDKGTLSKRHTHLDGLTEHGRTPPFIVNATETKEWRLGHCFVLKVVLLVMLAGCPFSRFNGFSHPLWSSCPCKSV